VFRHVFLLPVAVVLTTDHVVGLQRAHRLKDLRFFAVHGSKISGSRGLHRKQRDDLEEMVLDDVAQTAGGFVKRAAALHTEGFREDYLDAGHVVAIPDRLQKGVGEAKIKDVHNRFLSEEVIDAEDGVFREHGLCNPVELPCGGQVASEWFFDDDAGVLSQACFAQSPDHCFKERGWDSEIVRWVSGAGQFLFYCREGARVLVVATHVPEQRQKRLKGTLVIDSSRSLNAVCYALVKTIEAPLREGYADDWHLESASFHHGIQCREDHLVRQIARHSEEHQRV